MEGRWIPTVPRKAYEDPFEASDRIVDLNDHRRTDIHAEWSLFEFRRRADTLDGGIHFHFRHLGGVPGDPGFRTGRHDLHLYRGEPLLGEVAIGAADRAGGAGLLLRVRRPVGFRRKRVAGRRGGPVALLPFADLFSASAGDRSEGVSLTGLVP